MPSSASLFGAHASMPSFLGRPISNADLVDQIIRERAVAALHADQRMLSRMHELQESSQPSLLGTAAADMHLHRTYAGMNMGMGTGMGMNGGMGQYSAAPPSVPPSSTMGMAQYSSVPPPSSTMNVGGRPTAGAVDNVAYQAQQVLELYQLSKQQHQQSQNHDTNTDPQKETSPESKQSQPQKNQKSTPSA